MMRYVTAAADGDRLVLTLLQFFVLLWDQLQSRATNGTGRNSMTGDISYDAIKDRTSAAVGSGDEDGVLFDETIAAYSIRRKTAMEFLVGALTESHQKAFRAYVTRTQWTTISESPSVGTYFRPFVIS
jgi:RAD50-interacting protein 1